MSAECIGNPPLGASPGDAVRTEGASEQVDGDERKRKGATAEMLKETERKKHGRNGECRASIATAAIMQLAARRSHNPKSVGSILTRRICPHRRSTSVGKRSESRELLIQKCHHQLSHRRGIYVHADTNIGMYTVMCVYIHIYIYACVCRCTRTRLACALTVRD